MQRTERMEEMRQRCAALLSPAFAEAYVAPWIGSELGVGGCAVEIVRFHGTRVTLRYSFPSGAIVYAKTHREGAARKRFDTLRALWQAGFDGTRGLLVPEPVALLEHENMVLMREARGIPLSRVGECSLDAAIGRVRAAARWLVALHSTALTGLKEEAPCERLKILDEADLLAEAASAYPECWPSLGEFLGYVSELADSLDLRASLTPTHGQFIPSTIFVDSGTVTVIDLDTLRLSDPAKDVASLISRVKYRKLFNARVEPARAARLASEFVNEYSRSTPTNLANLPYYLALYCLRELAKFVLDADADGRARDRAERLCRWELMRCLREAACCRRSLSPAASGTASPDVSPIGAMRNPDAIEACRAAARRLSVIHRSGTGVRRPEREWVSLGLFRIVRRLVELCAAFPEHSRTLIEILHKLKDGVEGFAHAEWAAPAHDAAEYVADLRAGGFEGRYDHRLAEQGSRAFLDEYLSNTPGLGATIDCHLACCLTLRLLDSMTAEAVADSSWPRRSGLYLAAITDLCGRD